MNRFSLGDRELHVWSVTLDASPEVTAAFARTLSEPETARCARFANDALRRSFTLSHGVLRVLLGRYQGKAPEAVAFVYGHAQKPYLAPAGPLQFNMSHSGGLALYAFAHDRQVGVDVEHLRPIPEIESIAARFFSPEECQDLMSLDPSDRETAFFRCWTRKEAYIKAIAEGLSAPLDQFRVTLRPGQEAALLYTSLEPGHRWNLRHLEPAPCYLGAVAYDGEPLTVREWPLTTPDSGLTA